MDSEFKLKAKRFEEMIAPSGPDEAGASVGTMTRSSGPSSARSASKAAGLSSTSPANGATSGW